MFVDSPEAGRGQGTRCSATGCLASVHWLSLTGWEQPHGLPAAVGEISAAPPVTASTVCGSELEGREKGTDSHHLHGRLRPRAAASYSTALFR